MKGTPTDFWGKLEKDEAGTVVAWHPLFAHCADVAAVAERLLHIPLWRARLSRLAGVEDLGEITVARLSVLALFHDFGKLNLGFQAKGRPELGTTAGHVSEGVAALERGVFDKALTGLGGWGEAAHGLLVSSIGHHGRPVSPQAAGADYQNAWWTARASLDPRHGALRLRELAARWFPAAFEDGAPLPESAALEHAFAGLVMLADWLGSDKDYFPYAEHGAADRMDHARPMADRLVRAMALDVDLDVRRDVLARSAFVRVAPAYPPRPAQRAIAELVTVASPSVVILESETGSGKTEAALAHFVRLYEAGQVDGLYFALPTRTAATQIYERVYAATQQALRDPPPVILAVPGYLKADNEAGRRLPGFEVLWPDRDRFRFRAWAAEMPKRYLAGAIVVGTIDQVLLSSLMVGHAHLRATALLRQLLVVDEVHASDAYMTKILESVLERHVRAGGHALLLSATLGGETRSRLLRPGRDRQPVTLAAALEAPYPLVSGLEQGRAIFAAPEHEGGQREINVELAGWMEDPQRVMSRALSAAQAGAKVLVLKNTVRDCLEHQEALELLVGATERHLLFSSDGLAAPHHSRFARPDRECLDQALTLRIGKDRAAGGVVVVATQTVQQSLDIDADLLLTDLCPADVLLQRVGRLHRHVRRERPIGFERPLLVLLTPGDRDLGRLIRKDGEARNHHGLGSVYADLRILEATWRLAEAARVWRIPEMNRALVEAAVHSEALGRIVAEKGEAWSRHEAHVLGVGYGHTRAADLNLVDWQQPYSETSYAIVEDRRVTTRLGESDRRLRFDPALRSPFGQRVVELTVPARWAYGVPTEVEVATDVVSDEGVTRFSFGPKRFTYDRLGLRPGADDGEGDDDGP